MKKTLMVAALLLFTGFAFGQDTPVKESKGALSEVKVEEKKNIASADVTRKVNTAGLIKRLDLGISGGAVIYGDTLGYNDTLEARAYLLVMPYSLSFFSGGGRMYQYTNSDLHTINHIYGYVLGGCDYTGFKNFLPALTSLTLRGQLAFGGGYNLDRNSAGSTINQLGYVVYPSIGVDYSFGEFHANLMFGYELIGISSTKLSASTISIGASYTIF